MNTLPDSSAMVDNIFFADDDATMKKNIFQDTILSNNATIVLELLPYITAPLSLMGSLLILWTIYYERRTSMRQVYHRLVLGLSIADLLHALGQIVLGSWTVPTDLLYDFTRLGNGRGTLLTCSLNGFFFNMIEASLYYSVALSAYFKLQIKSGWSDRVLFRGVEIPAHLAMVVTMVRGALAATVKNSYNPLVILPGVCWETEYPPYCSRLEGVDCVRGQSTKSTLIAYLLTAWLCLQSGTIFACMTELIQQVYKTEAALRQYQVGHSGNQTSLMRTRETARQALLYVLTSIVTITPVSLVHFLLDDTLVQFPPTRTYQNAALVVAISVRLLTHMRGAFNAYIYLHKRWNKLRQPGNALSWIPKWVPLTKQPLSRDGSRRTFSTATHNITSLSVVGGSDKTNTLTSTFSTNHISIYQEEGRLTTAEPQEVPSEPDQDYSTRATGQAEEERVVLEEQDETNLSSSFFMSSSSLSTRASHQQKNGMEKDASVTSDTTTMTTEQQQQQQQQKQKQQQQQQQQQQQPPAPMGHDAPSLPSSVADSTESHPSSAERFLEEEP